MKVHLSGLARGPSVAWDAVSETALDAWRENMAVGRGCGLA